jgi:hypothetical protein
MPFLETASQGRWIRLQSSLRSRRSRFRDIAVHLIMEATIPGVDQPTLEKSVPVTNAVCPASQELNAEITTRANSRGMKFAQARLPPRASSMRYRDALRSRLTIHAHNLFADEFLQ